MDKQKARFWRAEKDRMVLMEGSQTRGVVPVTVEQRIEAAVCSGRNRTIIGTLLTGALTFHTALGLARQLKLIAPVETSEARQRGLIR